MNILIQLDTILTSFIYHLPHNVLFDTFFSFLSAVGSFGFIWIVIALYIIVVEERRDHRLFTIPFLLSIVISIVVSLALKNIFMRPRPLTTSLLDYSFPSLHAATAFTAAGVLSIFDKKRKYVFYLGALLIAFSRIYLGYHYVGDVIGGALLGIIISIVITYETQRAAIKKS